MDNRKINAGRTDVLVDALKMLETTDFEKMMGSGIMVKLTPITDGHHLTDEFMLAAEDMKTVAPFLAASLRKTLKLRMATLRSEMKGIENVIGKD